MNRRNNMAACAAILALLIATGADAHDPPPGGCGAFSSDVAHELAVMRSAAVPMTADTGASGGLPRLVLDKRYAISLVEQGQVRFRAKPGRAARTRAPRGGVFQFQVPASGRYRVSLTSRHWVDIVDGETTIRSVDHLGPGCDLVHKIVEFDLSSGRMLTLQLSGQDDAIIGLAITPSPSAP